MNKAQEAVTGRRYQLNITDISGLSHVIEDTGSPQDRPAAAVPPGASPQATGPWRRAVITLTVDALISTAATGQDTAGAIRDHLRVTSDDPPPSR
jgi:hypothetical protein